MTSHVTTALWMVYNTFLWFKLISAVAEVRSRTGIAECKEGMQLWRKRSFFHLPFPISVVSHFHFFVPGFTSSQCNGLDSYGAPYVCKIPVADHRSARHIDPLARMRRKVYMYSCIFIIFMFLFMHSYIYVFMYSCMHIHVAYIHVAYSSSFSISSFPFLVSPFLLLVWPLGSNQWRYMNREQMSVLERSRAGTSRWRSSCFLA